MRTHCSPPPPPNSCSDISGWGSAYYCRYENIYLGGVGDDVGGLEGGAGSVEGTGDRGSHGLLAGNDTPHTNKHRERRKRVRRGRTCAITGSGSRRGAAYRLYYVKYTYIRTFVFQYGVEVQVVIFFWGATRAHNWSPLGDNGNKGHTTNRLRGRFLNHRRITACWCRRGVFKTEGPFALRGRFGSVLTIAWCFGGRFVCVRVQGFSGLCTEHMRSLARVCVFRPPKNTGKRFRKQAFCQEGFGFVQSTVGSPRKMLEEARDPTVRVNNKQAIRPAERCGRPGTANWWLTERWEGCWLRRLLLCWAIHWVIRSIK